MRRLRRFFLSGSGWPYLLVPFIPIAVALELLHAEASLIFGAAALGVVPTAALMGRATEELAERTGPGIGGLLNVTFGNFPELVIAFFALREGLQEVVKASIIGSILGNVLLVMGAAMLVGGLKRQRQVFNQTAASVQVIMLLLAGAALILPAIFELVNGGRLPRVGEDEVDFSSTVERMSLIVSIVLLFTYAAGLLFSLKTHRGLFNPMHSGDEQGGGEPGAEAREAEGARDRSAQADAGHATSAQPAGHATGAQPAGHGGEGGGHGAGHGHGDGDEPWSVKRSTITLAIAGIAVGLMSEILVGSISEASEAIGLSDFFVGLIIVAVVGNAAEHWVAIYFAAKNKMDLAVNISIGSSAQIALFVAPVLVLLSFVVGPHPMSLVFNGYELAAVLLAVLVANFVVNEGESTWFEGLQLLALYVLMGVVFFYA